MCDQHFFASKTHFKYVWCTMCRTSSEVWLAVTLYLLKNKIRKTLGPVCAKINQNKQVNKQVQRVTMKTKKVDL